MPQWNTSSSRSRSALATLQYRSSGRVEHRGAIPVDADHLGVQGLSALGREVLVDHRAQQAAAVHVPRPPRDERVDVRHALRRAQVEELRSWTRLWPGPGVRLQRLEPRTR